MMPQASTAIYVKLLFTAFFWGGTWIAGRVAVHEASPMAIASWRFFIAALVLGALLVHREGRPQWSLRDGLLLSLLGLSGIFLYNIFFLYGLKEVEAGRGALVVAFIPALIALADWLIFRIPMSPLKALGVVLAMSGCLLVVTQGHPARLFTGEVGNGEWLLLGTAVSWTAYTLISRHCSKRYSPLAMTFGGCFSGWLMLTVLALADGSLFSFSGATWRGISSVIFLGLFGTAIAFTWYSEAISRIGSTKAAAFINMVPIFAVLLGALLLNERLETAILAGGALVVSGVFLTNRPGKTSDIRTSQASTRNP
ncbi:MAG: DMT family transporter [Betaproteobacteria bacterium]